MTTSRGKRGSKANPVVKYYGPGAARLGELENYEKWWDPIRGQGIVLGKF